MAPRSRISLQLFNPSFIVFLLRRGAIALYRSLLAFEVERTGTGASGRSVSMGRGVAFDMLTGLRIGEGTQLREGAEILLLDPATGSSSGTITLGKNVKIGKRVVLGASGETLQIGDQTSVHNGSIILGRVSIGRYCLLSCNIFISSGDHFARVRPAWLIRDQDALVIGNRSLRDSRTRGVTIEDDCWIGWGAVIKRGVYIGKGAMIGANSVVTKDVAPYSIQVGAPNRQIAERLKFQPPREVRAATEQHWPYFYAGFLLLQREIEESLRSGVIFATASARILLAGGQCSRLYLAGTIPSGAAPLKLGVFFNSVNLTTLELTDPTFSRSVEIDLPPERESTAARSSVLRDFHEVRIEVAAPRGSTSAPQYGLASVRLE